MESRTGYVDCSCRDCFDIAIGPLGTLCHDCAGAGCDAFYTECRRTDAYHDCNGCDECTPPGPLELERRRMFPGDTFPGK